jgi:hypothetical protein
MIDTGEFLEQAYFVGMGGVSWLAYHHPKPFSAIGKPLAQLAMGGLYVGLVLNVGVTVTRVDLPTLPTIWFAGCSVMLLWLTILFWLQPYLRVHRNQSIRDDQNGED